VEFKNWLVRNGFGKRLARKPDCRNPFIRIVLFLGWVLTNSPQGAALRAGKIRPEETHIIPRPFRLADLRQSQLAEKL